MTLAAGSTAALAFLPVWLRYGWNFFTFYENHDRPAFAAILVRGSFEVWGAIGLLALLILLLGSIPRRPLSLPPAMPPRANRLLVPAVGAIVVIYLLAYLRLPDQAGYLIPLVPAILLLAARFTPSLPFQTACFLLFLSP